MKKTFSPEEVLIAVINYYANNECSDFDVTVSAKFVGKETSVEIETESIPSDISEKVLDKTLN